VTSEDSSSKNRNNLSTNRPHRLTAGGVCRSRRSERESGLIRTSTWDPERREQRPTARMALREIRDDRETILQRNTGLRDTTDRPAAELRLDGE